MLTVLKHVSFQRLLQRAVVAWLLGAVLWSSSVAVAAAVMGCCDQPQACCSMGPSASSGSGCTTCVPPLSAASVAPKAPEFVHPALANSPYSVGTITFYSADIWRPPKASYGSSVFIFNLILKDLS